MSNPELSSKPQIFVSYTSADCATAKEIVEGLCSQGLNIGLDTKELHPGDRVLESIRNAISASSYFILLWSNNSLRSYWTIAELEVVLRELQSRDITFLPVLLEDCEIPPYLTEYQWFDMRSGVKENLERLTESLRAAPEIDFKKLSPQTFEKLGVDLLQNLGFVKLDEKSKQNDSGIDAVVEFRQKDPFGVETREIYMVETKLYQHSRVGLSTLRELADYAKNDPKINKALLITNSNLTSVALDWVDDAPKTIGVPIRVIEGTELRRLLLRNIDLISKYFTTTLSNAS